MKTGKWVIAASVIVLAIPLAAQQAGANAQQSGSATAGNASVNESASAGAAELANLRPVAGELAGKLDSKSAKVGDQVVVKTSQAARTADGLVIPRGSRIVGHVTDVQAHGAGHGTAQQDAHVTVQFDRVELKDGRSMPVRSVIESVSPSQAALSAAAGGNPGDAAYPGSAAGAGMPMGSAGAEASTRGGMAGAGVGAGGIAGGGLGTPGGMAGSAANTPGTVGARSGADAGGLARNAGNTAADLGPAAGGLYGGGPGLATAGVHATGLPGVMLTGDATGTASGTFSASKHNVHLDGGTQIVLGVAVTAGHQ